MSTRRTFTSRRVLVPLTTAAVLVVATALPAAAHVTVSSPDAAPGGFGKLVFRVPTESEDAKTTKLTVTLPRDTPFAFVSSKPLPGWTVATTERKLAKPIKAEGFTLSKAVATVTWTAGRGQGVAPGQFEEFELSVGPFPKGESSVALPATQTYSDGSVVRWDQPTEEGKAEPEHPAPTLDLADASTPAATSTPATGAAADQPDTLGRWLGGAGLLAGLAALAVALTGRRRSAT